MIRNLSGDGETSFVEQRARVVSPGDAGVMEPFVRVVRTSMARDAIAFTWKDLQAQARLRRQRGRITANIAVHRRVTRDDRAHIAGKGAGEVERVGASSENRLKLRGVRAVICESRYQLTLV